MPEEIRNLLGQQTPDQDRKADVIFVHGLDGDIEATWRSAPGPNGFWPVWLAKNLQFKVGLWSIGYPASSNAWKGHAQHLPERAINILARLKAEDIGYRPIVFIAHSLGGLVVKEMLRTADGVADKRYKNIQAQTRGIVFLATPHTGSRLANWMRMLPFLSGKNISDLVYNSPDLLRLNRWFRDNYLRLRINTTVYTETQNVRGLRVVDLISSDPALANVTPIPLDENHISISKPKSERSLLYKGIVQFINETLSDGGKPSADEMSYLAEQFMERFFKGSMLLHKFAHDARDLCVKLMPRKPEPPATRPNGSPILALSGDSHYQHEGDFVTLLTSLAGIFRYLVPPHTKVWACIRERHSDDRYYTWVRSSGCNSTRKDFSEPLHKDSTTVQKLRKSYEVDQDCVIITGVGCDGWTPLKNDGLGENKSVIMSAVLSKSFNPTGLFDDPKLNWLLCVNADRPNVFNESHIPLMKACNDICSWILNTFIRYDAMRYDRPPRPPGNPEPTV